MEIFSDWGYDALMFAQPRKMSMLFSIENIVLLNDYKFVREATDVKFHQSLRPSGTVEKSG